MHKQTWNSSVNRFLISPVPRTLSCSTHQDIDPSELLGGLINRALDLILLPDITHNRKGCTIPRADDIGKLKIDASVHGNKDIFRLPLPPAFSISSAAVWIVPGS